MELTFRPITIWPGKFTTARKKAQFTAGYSSTLKMLDQELVKLGARNVVLQVALSESDIRLDGRPRASSRPAHPGVILSFDSKHGALSYPCDTFDDWEDNLRAIALSLEHLRAVDRYGVTKKGEQYKGWTALPGPKANNTPTSEKVAAVQLLQKYASGVINSKEAAKLAYRAAAKATHPDVVGDPEEFKRVQAARQTLGID